MPRRGPPMSWKICAAATDGTDRVHADPHRRSTRRPPRLRLEVVPNRRPAAGGPLARRAVPHRFGLGSSAADVLLSAA